MYCSYIPNYVKKSLIFQSYIGINFKGTTYIHSVPLIHLLILNRTFGYLQALPSWNGTNGGSISFKFRSNEPDGLLLYNGATIGKVRSYPHFHCLDNPTNKSMDLSTSIRYTLMPFSGGFFCHGAAEGFSLFAFGPW